MDRLHIALIALLLLVAGTLAFVATRPPPMVTDREAVSVIVAEALAAQAKPEADEAAIAAIVDSRLAAQPPAPDDAAIRTLVEAVLAERDADAPLHSNAAIDPGTLNPMIESYLLNNPRILQRVSEALQLEIRTAEIAAAKTVIATMRDEIFNDPEQIVVGNPNGDVTLVEMFDYNCGYCRSVLPDLATLIAEDPNLRVVLKEFPILSQESVDAARVGVLVAQSDIDYWAFHEKLFTARGQVSGETALQAAADLGLDRTSLALDMSTTRVTAVIDRSYEIARALKISGTPAFIIGDEMIPGAVGIDELRLRIANMRACGATVCPAAETAAEAEIPAAPDAAPDATTTN